MKYDTTKATRLAAEALESIVRLSSCPLGSAEAFAGVEGDKEVMRRKPDF
jgi:hypothetical protein